MGQWQEFGLSILNDLDVVARALLYFPLFAAFESPSGSAVKLYNVAGMITDRITPLTDGEVCFARRVIIM